MIRWNQEVHKTMMDTMKKLDYYIHTPRFTSSPRSTEQLGCTGQTSVLYSPDNLLCIIIS